MLKLLLIGFGGALGTLTRYGTATALLRLGHRTGFPFGTLVVNLIGCFLIGYLNGLFLSRVSVRPEVQLMLVVGFLGGFTTFSAFGWETGQLLQEGQYLRAGANIVVSNVVGIALAMGGFALGKG